MRARNQPVLSLKHVAEGALQNTGASPGKTRGVVAQFRTAPSRFHANHLDLPVGDEVIKEADGVAAPAHAGEEHVRQLSRLRQDLAASFLPDHPLKLAHHERVRMRPSTEPSR